MLSILRVQDTVLRMVWHGKLGMLKTNSGSFMAEWLGFMTTFLFILGHLFKVLSLPEQQKFS